MIVLAIVTVVFSAVAIYIVIQSEGFKVKWFKWLPSTVIIVIATILAGQAGYSVAANVAKDDAIGGYHQFLNGTVVAAHVSTNTCTLDGSCSYTYSCFPHLVPITSSYTDSKGVRHTTTTYVTHYHDCPYVTQEFTYSTADSIGGSQQFGTTVSAHPVQWKPSLFERTETSDSSLDALPTNVPRGVPALWQKVHTALAAGIGVPMTTTDTYQNYILASSDDLLKSSSTKINLLKKKHLLPEHTQNLENPIYNVYDAKKFTAVGFTPNGASKWQDSVMQFNAALGSTLRGDLHVIAIKASLLPGSVSPEQYLTAVKADWLNEHGKYALAKNAVVVVIGVDDAGTNILWSKATTGMPSGNGAMLQSLSTSLIDTPFTVKSVFGSTTAHVSGGKATYTIGSGLVAQAIMVEFPFKRVCMACTSAGDKGSIGYVSIPIPAHVGVGGYIVTSLLVMLFGALLWGVYIFFLGNSEIETSDDDYYTSRPRYVNKVQSIKYDQLRSRSRRRSF